MKKNLQFRNFPVMTDDELSFYTKT